MIGLLNRPITNCPITTWGVNKWKRGIFFRPIIIEEIVIFMINTVMHKSGSTCDDPRFTTENSPTQLNVYICHNFVLDIFSHTFGAVNLISFIFSTGGQGKFESKIRELLAQNANLLFSKENTIANPKRVLLHGITRCMGIWLVLDCPALGQDDGLLAALSVSKKILPVKTSRSQLF